MVVVGFDDGDVVWSQLQYFIKVIRTIPSLGFCHHDGGSDHLSAATMLAARPELAQALIT